MPMLLALLFDAILLALSLVWLGGGLPWHGHLLFRHGADARRAMLLLGFLAAWRFPALRERSFFLRSALAFGRRLLQPRFRWGVIAAVCAWAALVGVLQTLALRVPLYDVGIYHQVIWGIAHGYGFISTISKAGNYLMDHLSFSYVLLAPVFWLTGSSPLTLPVIHALLIFGGGSAWVYMAERIPGASPSLRSTLAAATTLFLVCFDSLWGNMRWGFHETAIVFAAMSWAFAWIFLAERRSLLARLGILALFLLAAASKEIDLVDAAFACVIWAYLEKEVRPARLRLVPILFAVALVGGFVYFEHLHHPADKNYFDRYYSYLGHNLPEFLHTLLLSPGEVIRHIGAGELFRYFFRTVFLPWLFLPLVYPFVSRRYSLALWLGAIAPSLASAALSTDFSLRGPNFHYVMELWPLLAALTIGALARIDSKRLVWAWALLALVMMDHDPWGEFREYLRGAITETPARAAIASIPESAVLSADEMTGPWVANRRWVTRLPDLTVLNGECPEWVVTRDGSSTVELIKGHALSERCAWQPLMDIPIWKVGEWTAYRRN